MPTHRIYLQRFELKICLRIQPPVSEKKKGWLEAVHASTPFLAGFGLAFSISDPTLCVYVDLESSLIGSSTSIVFIGIISNTTCASSRFQIRNFQRKFLPAHIIGPATVKLTPSLRSLLWLIRVPKKLTFFHVIPRDSHHVPTPGPVSMGAHRVSNTSQPDYSIS